MMGKWDMSGWQMFASRFCVCMYVLFECLIVVVSVHVRSRDVVYGS